MNDNKVALRIGNIYKPERVQDGSGTGFAGNVYHTVGIAPTLNTMAGGGKQPSVVVKIERTTNDNAHHCSKQRQES